MALELHGRTGGSTSAYQQFTTVSAPDRRCFLTGTQNAYVSTDDGTTWMIALLGSNATWVDLGVIDPATVKVKNVGTSGGSTLWSISAGESR